MARTGRCLCGQITYEITGDLIATAVCHCDHCQRQSGGAFSVNLIVHESQMTVSGTLNTFEDRGENGDAVYVQRRFCGQCGSPIVSALRDPAGVIAVKAGTLDDRSEVTPTVEVWCDHKQPWVQLPSMAASLAREMTPRPPSIPASASDHPAGWKFDFPIYHPGDLAAWRAWLAANCDTGRGVWVASWRKASGRDAVPYEDLVEEAICFGWIDSTANTLDDERGLQLMTPRKPKSGWTRLNRQRVAALEAEGRMTDAGRRAVDVAKANGWWTIYDSVEDLLEPDELAAALDACPAARRAWAKFPPSARKQMLWWVVSASRPETRTSRIAKIVAEAASGRRVQG